MGATNGPATDRTGDEEPPEAADGDGGREDGHATVGGDAAHDRPIDVRLSVAPGDGCACPPGEGETGGVRQSFNLGSGGSRSCQVLVSEGGPDRYYRLDPTHACPCFVFAVHDCVAELEEIRNGRLYYAVTLPGRDGLAPLVDRLRQTGATVSVDRILAADQTAEDTSTLTEKQRRALFVAIDCGYYEQPREATLDDVADRLDVTASAASQRLNAVKRRLVRSYARRADDPPDGERPTR
ncbi:MAG: helix-turn-helix domain-containing protein [Halobacteriaceae archaeon]